MLTSSFSTSTLNIAEDITFLMNFPISVAKQSSEDWSFVKCQLPMSPTTMTHAPNSF